MLPESVKKAAILNHIVFCKVINNHVSIIPINSGLAHHEYLRNLRLSSSSDLDYH